MTEHLDRPMVSLETAYRRLLGAILIQAVKDAKAGDNGAVGFLKRSGDLFDVLDVPHDRVVAWIHDGMPGDKRIHTPGAPRGRRKPKRAKRQPTRKTIRPAAQPVQLAFAIGD